MKLPHYHANGIVHSFTAILLPIVLTASACSRQNGNDQQPELLAPSSVAEEEVRLELPMQPDADRRLLTAAQCAGMGGSVVGDPGDGRVHRTDYICESGETPLGTIQFEAGESISIEGSVCCPQ